MTLADAHIHLFPGGYPGRYGHAARGAPDIALYEAYRREHGIERALVVGYEADGIDPENNSYLRSLAAEHGWIASLAYVAPAPAPDPGRLAALIGAGHRGLSLYVATPDAAAALAAWPDAALDVLNTSGAILSFNIPPEPMQALAPLWPRLAGARVLISHLGLPGRFPSPPDRPAAEARIAALLDAARHAHVGVKISGLYAISAPAHAWPHAAAGPFAAALLDRFGPGRLYWGSDFSPCLDFVSFAQSADLPPLAGLGADERAAIMGGNLLRLLSEH